MKHAYQTSDEVAHIWANHGDTEEIYSAGQRTSARNGRFWSYSTVIAQFSPSNDVVFVSEERHSNTTAKHQRSISSALRYSDRIIYVTDSDFLVHSTPSDNAKDKEKLAQENIITNLLNKQLRARKYDYSVSISSKLTNYYKFCSYYDIEPTYSELSPEDWGDVGKALEVAKANKLKEDEIIKSIMPEVQSEYNTQIINFREHKPYGRMLDLFADKPQRSLMIKALQKLKDNATDIIRLSIHHDKIETNRGASVSLSDAELLYHGIKRGSKLNGMRLGYYTVTSNNGKTISIGCHKFNIKTELPYLETILQSTLWQANSNK